MYADNVKLYIPIYSQEDCIKLQSELDYFDLWCSSHGLNINANKYSQILFTRRKSNINFQYRISSSGLMIVTQIRDLGILLTNDVYFNNYINMMNSKAFRVFSFIRHI